jgi:hypothetical protein
MEADAKPAIECLPVEMLTYVFEQLFTGRDPALSAFLPCMLVCRHWRRVMLNVGTRASANICDTDAYRRVYNAVVEGGQGGPFAIRIASPGDWARETARLAACEGHVDVLVWAHTHAGAPLGVDIYRYCAMSRSVTVAESVRVLFGVDVAASISTLRYVVLTPSYVDWYQQYGVDTYALWLHLMRAGYIPSLKFLHWKTAVATGVELRAVRPAGVAATEFLRDMVLLDRYTIDSIQYVCLNFELDKSDWWPVHLTVYGRDEQVSVLLARHGFVVESYLVPVARHRGFSDEAVSMLESCVRS